MTGALRGDFCRILGGKKNRDELAYGKLLSFLVDVYCKPAGRAQRYLEGDKTWTKCLRARPQPAANEAMLTDWRMTVTLAQILVIGIARPGFNN
jgi:hypothetical protein